MNQKTKKQITHWFSVIIVGVILGLAIQFVRAWTEPAVAPPGGNLGAPINTGANVQEKGDATHNADICVWNGGIKKCLSTVGDTVISGIPSGTIDGSISTMIWSGGATAGLTNSCTAEPPGFCRGLTPMCESGWTVKQTGWGSSGGDNIGYCGDTQSLGDCAYGSPSGWVGYTAYTYTCVKD